jgi:uncharacterized protein DUF6456
MRRKSRKAAVRLPDAERPDIGGYRARHLALGERQIDTASGRARVVVDDNESPLIWLARRRGRDGRFLVEPHQFQAGERLRRDFTYAHLMPSTTSNWSNPLAPSRSTGAAPASAATDTMVAARQRVHQALDAVEPEFSGLLLDVCCFLKRLEDVERERAWPVRSGKIVLRLALERLARHYGLAAQTRGPSGTQIRTWLADGACFRIDPV